MEKKLSVIRKISLIVCGLFVIFALRYYTKDTLLSLTAYVVSSVVMCVLQAMSMNIKFNLNKNYNANLLNLGIFSLNVLLCVVFIMKEIGVV